MRASSSVLFLAWLLTWLAGCGPAGRPYFVSLSTVPPSSLQSIATSVRGVGGVVFVGELDGAITSTAPQIGSTSLPDVFLSQPQSVGTVRVVDALGAALGDTVLIVAPSGTPELVDARGEPSDAYYLETDNPNGWEAYALPTSGQWVFFATPAAGGAFLTNWRAAVTGDLVDGGHTIEGGQVALETLRLP